MKKKHAKMNPGAAQVAAPPEPDRFASALYICLGIMGIVLLTNLLWPRNYRFFAWDYASYFNPGLQVLWTAVCTAAALLAFRMRDRLEARGRLLFAAGVALILLTAASFYFCMCGYPTIAGDGEYGELTMRSTKRFHLMLGAFMADRVFKESLLSVWVSMEMWAGVVYALICGIVAWKMKGPALGRLGLLMFALGNPMLLNCLGHYDSYGIPMVVHLLWWLWLYRCERTSGMALAPAALAGVVITGLACWAHPVFALLAAAAVYYAFLRMVQGGLDLKITAIFGAKGFGGFLAWGLNLFRRPRFVFFVTPLFALALAGMLLFYTPQYLLRPDVDGGKFPLVGEYLRWFLHSKIMGWLWVAMPAGAVFLWLMAAARPWRRPVSPLASAALVALWASFLCYFTLLFEQGLNDELPCTLIGMMAMGAAAILVLEWAPERGWNALAAFGALAVFLHAPKVLVYGSDRYVDRLVAIYPYDRCPHNNKMSSYTHLGLILPMETERARMARLEVFRQGMESKLPYWQNFNTGNMMYYVAWSYEFGRGDDARPILHNILRNIDKPQAQQLLMYLVQNGTQFTYRWRNKAYRLIRDDVKALALQEYELTQRPILLQAVGLVDKLDAGERRPGGSPGRRRAGP